MTTRADVLVATPRRVRTARRPGGLREVAWLAGPAVLQTLSDTVLHVVDTVIVGQLGTAELGGVGFGGLWLWTGLSFFVGAGTGVQTFVARALGEGAGRAKGAWLWQSAWALVPAVTLWMFVLASGIESFLRWLGPAPGLVEPALSYIYWRLPGGPAIVASVLLASFFRGLGDTRTPLFAALVANSLNVFLSYAWVLGEFGSPAWGVAGAGASTSIANWVAVAILAFALFRRKMVARHGTLPPRRPQATIMWRYLRTSLPIGGQWVLDMCSFALFATLVARMGAESAAANQAMIQLLSLSFMQAMGIAIAAGALVGRYVGARDMEAAERSHRSAQLLGLIVAGVVGLLFLTFPQELLGLFSRSSEVLELGRSLLVLGALFQLVDAAGIIVAGALRGAGDTRWPFLLQTSAAWLLRLPLAWVFVLWWDRGILGAWWAELLYVTTVVVLLQLRFRSGAWRRVRV